MFEASFDVTPRAAMPEVMPTPSLPQIRRLQATLAEMPQVDCPLEHFFAPGMYMRKCTIPAGTVVVGKMHRHQHPTMLVKGEATILTNKGMERIQAPYLWISQENAKRPVFAHTDCEFVTVHLNTGDTTDLDRLEAEIIIPEALTHEREALEDFTDEIQRMYA